jgi:hypothetical protein
MVTGLRQALFIELLGSVKVPQVFITLDEDVQDFQVLRLLEVSLLQFLNRELYPAGFLKISRIL